MKKEDIVSINLDRTSGCQVQVLSCQECRLSIQMASLRRPPRPEIRYIREDDDLLTSQKCYICGSSLHKKWNYYFFGKIISDKCINPDCERYHKKK